MMPLSNHIGERSLEIYANCFITCDLCLFHDAVNTSEDTSSNYGKVSIKVSINYALSQWIIILFYMCVNFAFMVRS